MSVDGSQVRKSHFRRLSKQIYDLSLVLVKMRCISEEEPQKKKRGLIILTVFGNESLSWNSGEFGIYNLAMSTGVSYKLSVNLNSKRVRKQQN